MKWTLPRFALFLAIALTLWLWPSIFGGKVLLPLDILSHNPPFVPATQAPIRNELIGDMLFENYAWKHFQRECIKAGELPLWNPHSFCGHPIYTTGQTSTFYPFNVLFWVIPLPYAYVVFTWLHLFLGGLFTYLFLRRLNVGGFGAAVGGVMFAMSTFFGVRFIWPMLLGSAIWLPLMLLWIDHMTEPRNLARPLRGIGLGSLLFALPILSGFFEIAFYAFVACAMYTLFEGVKLFFRNRSWHPGLVLFGKVGSVAILAAMLSAPQLLPFFEVMKRNVRAGELTYQDALDASLTAEEALTLVMPDALGNPARHEGLDLRSRAFQAIQAPNGQDFQYFGPKNYVCTGYYLGLVPLAFILLSVVASGRRRWFFWTLLAISLALAFGSPLYKAFFYLVPGADQVRTPFRWMYLVVFAGCYLAAIGAQRWHDELIKPTWRLARIAATLKLLVVAALCLLVVVLLFKPAPVLDLAESILQTNKRAAGTFKDAGELAGLMWLNAVRFSVFLLAAFFFGALAFWKQWRPTGAAFISLICLALVAFDLGQATYDFNTHADPALLKQEPPIVKYLQDAQAASAPEPFRIGRKDWRKIFYPNLPTLYALQDVGGYDSIILTHFARFMAQIEYLKLLQYNLITSIEQRASLDSPLLPLLNIRYLMATEEVKHPDWEPIAVPGNVRLYQVRPEKALPRAFLVGEVEQAASLEGAIRRLKRSGLDLRQTAVVETTPATRSHLVDPGTTPPGTVRIEHYRPSSVRLAVSPPRRQFLVLLDVYYPGWRAYVDGRETDIIVTNGVFRGVSVPPGDHTVEFRFEPARLRIGAALSAACLIGLMIFGIVGRVKRAGTHGSPSSSEGPSEGQPAR